MPTNADDSAGVEVDMPISHPLGLCIEGLSRDAHCAVPNPMAMIERSTDPGPPIVPYSTAQWYRQARNYTSTWPIGAH